MFFILNIPEKMDISSLYNKYNRILYKYALSILKNTEDTEDAVHIAYIRIAENMDKINNAGEAKTINYMITIVKNVAIDIYNRRKKEMFFYKENTKEMEEKVLKTNDFGIFEMKDAINTLEERDKELLLLKYTYGYTVAEIAKHTGISETNVTTKISRIKNKMKNILSEGKAENVRR